MSLLLVLALYWSCSSSKFSYKNRNSTLDVAVVEKQNILKIDLQNPQELVASREQRGMFAPLLGKSLNFATQLVKKAIDNEQKKYISQDESGVTDLFFYDNVSQISTIDPTGMQFGGIRIVRTFETKKGVMDTAYVIELAVDTTDVQGILNNEFFHLIVKKVDIRYAEAKVPGAKWYFPWTYYQHKTKDDKLNMDIEISLTSSFVNSDGELKSDVEMGKFFLFLHGIPLNPKAIGYEEYRTKLKGQALIGKCFLVPRSLGHYMENYGVMKECFSKGNYNVTVAVTESGGDKFVNKFLFHNSEILINEAAGNVKKVHFHK